MANKTNRNKLCITAPEVVSPNAPTANVRNIITEVPLDRNVSITKHIACRLNPEIM